MLYDYAILGLRITVAVVFISSGWNNITKTRERSESLGLFPAVTAGLGMMYLLCSSAIILGVYIQIASALIIFAMLGGLYKKLFIWKPGIWGDKRYDGWHYNIIFIFSNLLFIADSGRFVITNTLISL